MGEAPPCHVFCPVLVNAAQEFVLDLYPLIVYAKGMEKILLSMKITVGEFD